jgi:hypothetical protein
MMTEDSLASVSSKSKCAVTCLTRTQHVESKGKAKHTSSTREISIIESISCNCSNHAPRYCGAPDCHHRRPPGVVLLVVLLRLGVLIPWLPAILPAIARLCVSGRTTISGLPAVARLRVSRRRTTVSGLLAVARLYVSRRRTTVSGLPITRLHWLPTVLGLPIAGRLLPWRCLHGRRRPTAH